MPLSDQDRDMMIRTIIGEAGDQSSTGQVAVAHVIMNRVQAGSWGNSPSDVVLARGQFEPWQTRRSELAGISPRSQQYRQVGQVVDGVTSGQIPDPTGGATHFLDPAIVKGRRGGTLPDWAQGPNVSIGDHNFYAPDNPHYGSAVAAINDAIGAPNSSSGAMAYTDTPSSPGAPPRSLFGAGGFTMPGAPAAPAAASATSPADSTPKASLFAPGGFTMPQAAPTSASTGPAPAAASAQPAAPLPPGAAGAVYVPGSSAPTYVDAGGKFLPLPAPVPKTISQRFMEATDPGALLGNPGQSTVDAFSSSRALTASGWQDATNRNLWPSFPSSDPQTWSGGGVLKTGAGVLGMATSPLSGTLDALVAQPTTALTGDPETGQRASMVAGALIGGPKMAASAKSMLPSSKALDTLVKTIGPENVPAAVSRMADNPALTLMDVSDPVRTMAQGLIDPAQPTAQNILTQAVKDRAAGRTAAVNEAYTDAMGPTPNIMAMVEGLKERARAAGREAIQPALANAKPVDVTPVINAIDAEVKPGMTALLDPGTQLPLSPLQQELLRFKSQLTTGGEQAFDAQNLHEIQSRMGDQAYQLSISPDPKDRMLGGQLRGFNEKLIDQIDEASSSTYRPARALFKDAKDISAAFDSGFDTLKNRSGLSGLEDRPEAFQAWMDQATPEEIVARRLGTRADIDQKINGVRNPGLAGETITKIPYNQQKLASLFGPDEAQRLISRMNDASDMAATNSKLIAGSKTAETIAGRQALEVPKVEPFRLGSPLSLAGPAVAEGLAYTQGIPPGIAGAAVLGGGLATGVARKVGQTVSQRMALASNVAFARAASATGPARQQAMGALLTHPQVVRALQKSGNALTVP